jgi:hypothetical protein
MVSKPLGDYEAFEGWSGEPRRWGPEGAGWRAWFGGKVIDGLCDVLDEHLAAPRHRGMHPAAIGCVPWLTSRAVASRLLAFASYCVVVDKGPLNKGQRAYRRQALDRLSRGGRGRCGRRRGSLAFPLAGCRSPALSGSRHCLRARPDAQSFDDLVRLRGNRSPGSNRERPVRHMRWTTCSNPSTPYEAIPSTKVW